MVKTVKIGNKEYDLKSSAYTMFKYKNDMQRDLLKDISAINDKYTEISNLPKEEQDIKWISEISGILDMALHLAYIMIQEQDSNFKISYEDWLKELDALCEDTEWIPNVLEVGISPFLGRIQNSQQQDK